MVRLLCEAKADPLGQATASTPSTTSTDPFDFWVWEWHRLRGQVPSSLAEINSQTFVTHMRNTARFPNYKAHTPMDVAREATSSDAMNLLREELLRRRHGGAC